MSRNRKRPSAAPAAAPRATEDWTPAAFTLVDIAACSGAERYLVDCMFAHHIAAQQLVMADLATVDIPVMRARAIMLSCSLVVAGIDGCELRLPVETFALAATDALSAAAEMVEIGSDIQGEA